MFFKLHLFSCISAAAVDQDRKEDLSSEDAPIDQDSKEDLYENPSSKADETLGDSVVFHNFYFFARLLLFFQTLIN
jgi:hypothetical protein